MYIYAIQYYMQRWCNIPCLIRCNIFASTAFSYMFKMFLKGWCGDVSLGGVLSVLNTKCFIHRMRYYIAIGLTYERDIVCMVCIYIPNRLVYIIIIIYT